MCVTSAIETLWSSILGALVLAVISHHAQTLSWPAAQASCEVVLLLQRRQQTPAAQCARVELVCVSRTRQTSARSTGQPCSNNGARACSEKVMLVQACLRVLRRHCSMRRDRLRPMR